MKNILHYFKKKLKQAGAELGQAQPKLDGIEVN